MLSLGVAARLLRSCWEARGAKGEQTDKSRHPAEPCSRELCRMMQFERKAWKDFETHLSWQLLHTCILHQILAKCKNLQKTHLYLKKNGVKVFATYVAEVRFPISAQHWSAVGDMVVAEVLSHLRHVICKSNILAVKINVDTYRVCPWWQLSRGLQSRHRLSLQFNSPNQTAHHACNCAWYCTVLHGIAWCCMVLYGIGWYVLYRVLYGIGWYVWYVYCMALLYGVSVCLYCLVLHCMHEWCMHVMLPCFMCVFMFMYTVYYVMFCCGAVLCGIVFYVWYGMVWCGMVWYGCRKFRS